MKKYFAVFVIFFLFWLVFFLYTGTITSGYQFTDDHEILSIDMSISKIGLMNTIVNFVKNDLNIRFRPLYYIHRVLEVAFFKDNLIIWSSYNIVLATLTTVFLFSFLKLLNYSFLDSTLFAFLTLIGAQTAIWWRLGPAETLGVFLLSISLLFLSLSLKYPSKKLFTFLFFVFCLLMSLMKESFVIIIPALVLFKIWQEKKNFYFTFLNSFKNNYLSILLLVILAVEIAIIKFIGTNNIGYAGTTNINEMIQGIKNIVTQRTSLFNWILYLPAFSILFLTSFLSYKYFNIKELGLKLREILPNIFFAFLVIVPNIVLYAKSGMTERYLLPAVLGVAFILISLLSINQKPLFKTIMYVLLFLFIGNNFAIAKIDALNFTRSGKQTHILLQTIKGLHRDNPKILLVVDPVQRFELSWSLKTYCLYIGCDLFAYSIPGDYTTDFEFSLEKGWQKWFENKNLQNLNGAPNLVIIFDKKQRETFFSESKIHKMDYRNILQERSWYDYDVYLKN